MNWRDILRSDVGEILNDLGDQYGCPSLCWDLDRGLVGSPANGDPSTAGKWAELLGLEPRCAAPDGRVEYCGHLGEIPLTIRAQRHPSGGTA
ncbi:hypothetical protein HFP15_29305 [Amycolatopsis sp. K13G38]|uniref:Uncharacterized protein n=1 Tax=Amycolatopsis acididurans TaxID=2724524 RepID=A0ABX1JB35_9PSEU|nr:hypothetical protein [Amycolatopsis acididurans]NKQ56973.1 hypothetical protein [Amycolatopsis acididurans]